MTVLLNDGSGNFTQASFATGPNPYGITTGDFNGDGNADLAVTNVGDSTVTVLLGSGAGSFTPAAVSPPDGGRALRIVTGDFNGDGIADLATANNLSSTVTILLGNGDGTFASSLVSLPPASAPSDIVLADFNGDGILDFATVNSNAGTIIVELGKGDGSFTSHEFAPFAPEQLDLYSLATADFNGDGIPDLAVLDLTGKVVRLTLGIGDGTFIPSSASATLESSKDSVYMVAADFNGDGLPDIAAPDQNNNSLSLVLNTTTTSSIGKLRVSIPGSGTHDVLGFYPGASFASEAVSNTLSLQASPIETQLLLTAPATGTYGKQVTLTATLTPFDYSTLSTKGESITFSSSGAVLGTAPLSNGVATLNAVLPVGADKLSATYTSDGLFANSTSNQVPTQVGMPGANNASLKGQYAFLFHGYLPFNDKPPYGFAAAASFTADGGGNITAGVEDINSGSALSENLALSGTYSIGADGRGTMQLASNAGTSFTIAIAVSGLQADGTAATANIILLSNSLGLNGEGVMMQQQPSDFSLAALTGSYAFGLAGETSCYSGCSYLDHSGGAASATWMTLLNGSTSISGTADEEVASTPFADQALNGTIGQPDPLTGRTTISLNASVTADQPTHYVSYVVDASHMLLLSADPHSTTILLSGVGKRQ